MRDDEDPTCIEATFVTPGEEEEMVVVPRALDVMI